MKRVVIGLVGKLGAGKGVVAGILENEFGFYRTSLSDRIREELNMRGLKETRELMQKSGNELRNSLGVDVLAKRTGELLLKVGASRIVIDGIRNPREVSFIREHLGGIIWGVMAEEEKRFENVKKRGRIGDPQTLEDFLKVDDGENSGKLDWGQKINQCLEITDLNLENDGSLEELKEKVRDEVTPVLET